LFQKSISFIRISIYIDLVVLTEFNNETFNKHLSTVGPR